MRFLVSLRFRPTGDWNLEGSRRPTAVADDPLAAVRSCRRALRSSRLLASNSRPQRRDRPARSRRKLGQAASMRRTSNRTSKAWPSTISRRSKWYALALAPNANREGRSSSPLFSRAEPGRLQSTASPTERDRSVRVCARTRTACSGRRYARTARCDAVSSGGRGGRSGVLQQRHARRAPGRSRSLCPAASAFSGAFMRARELPSGLTAAFRPQLQYHLYHPLPSTNPRHLSSTLPSRNGSHSPTTSFFLPPALHISLTQKSEATQATPTVDLKLPEEVGGYTGLVPLDKPPSEGAAGAGGMGWAGYRGWVYKAWKEGEGRCYVLRRVEGESGLRFIATSSTRAAG